MSSVKHSLKILVHEKTDVLKFIFFFVCLFGVFFALQKLTFFLSRKQCIK